ncbi:YlzJ-like family protein [Propionispora hippei]|uniref:YlzJ-like protein n=1 Tax=Propionispora hippei DSM 15287 TaxID=1123003 RepID=A0A1M6D9J9_9FIRM|nr:YlzJ-like family protein [Propionispora hippei]SHI69893.1 YlzJ-like protein [Propionispora hippei DSM 15287]
MLLWTIMPLESIFPAEPYQPDYEEVTLGQSRVLMERINARQCKVVRLITTDPGEYLDPRLQPGTVVAYSSSPTSLNS